MDTGYTLLEISAALVLVGLTVTAAVPRAAEVRDGLAATAAREAVAGLVAEARVLAVAGGGAVVHFRSGPWRAWAQVGDTVVRTIALEEELGVSVDLSRGRMETALSYDALGLGRVASETLTFRRGAAARKLVISGYGRVRRP